MTRSTIIAGDAGSLASVTVSATCVGAPPASLSIQTSPVPVRPESVVWTL
jgi:hypothetical protein